MFPSFLDNKLLVLFQEENQTGAANSTTSDAVVGSSAAGSEETAERIITGADSSNASTINATNVPTSLEGGNQSTSEVRMHINEACMALSDSDNQGAMMHLELALNALYGASSEDNITDTAATCDATNSTTAGGSPLATWVIVGFSFVALGTVSYMICRRFKELEAKAWTTFMYLLELEAITNRSAPSYLGLQDIERYISSGDWTLAEIKIRTAIDDFTRELESTAGRRTENESTAGRGRGKKKDCYSKIKQYYKFFS